MCGDGGGVEAHDIGEVGVVVTKEIDIAIPDDGLVDDCTADELLIVGGNLNAQSGQVCLFVS